MYMNVLHMHSCICIMSTTYIHVDIYIYIYIYIYVYIGTLSLFTTTHGRSLTWLLFAYMYCVALHVLLIVFGV